MEWKTLGMHVLLSDAEFGKSFSSRSSTKFFLALVCSFQSLDVRLQN